MGWVWGMVYGNRNRTGVCGTWRNERAQLAETPASRLRADGPADEIEAWEPLGEDAVAAELAGIPDGNPNQQVGGSIKASIGAAAVNRVTQCRVDAGVDGAAVQALWLQ